MELVSLLKIRWRRKEIRSLNLLSMVEGVRMSCGTSSSIFADVVVLRVSEWGWGTCLAWRLAAAKAREVYIPEEVEIGPIRLKGRYLLPLESDLSLSSFK